MASKVVEIVTKCVIRTIRQTENISGNFGKLMAYSHCAGPSLGQVQRTGPGLWIIMQKCSLWCQTVKKRLHQSPLRQNFLMNPEG